MTNGAAPPPTAQPGPDAARAELAEALAAVGRRVRDVVRDAVAPDDHLVVRSEGGDDVFGVDARADVALIDELRARCAERWPGNLVIEGFDEPVAIGRPDGPWVYLADPVDGTRGHLAGTRSAWVLLGAGHAATDLAGLDIAAAVEIPTRRAALGTVARAAGSHLLVTDEALDAPDPADTDTDTDSTLDTDTTLDTDLAEAARSVPVELRPMVGADLSRRFVTVVRLLPGGHGPIGAFVDRVLDGLEVYDDLYPCSGGQLMAVAGGAAAAVIDPRPLLHPDGFHTHPYDLAALAVARAAGVVVDGLPSGPLRVPIDTGTPVAWAAYANHEVADLLRPRIQDALRAHGR